MSAGLAAGLEQADTYAEPYVALGLCRCRIVLNFGRKGELPDGVAVDRDLTSGNLELANWTSTISAALGKNVGALTTPASSAAPAKIPWRPWNNQPTGMGTMTKRSSAQEGSHLGVLPRLETVTTPKWKSRSVGNISFWPPFPHFPSQKSQLDASITSLDPPDHPNTRFELDLANIVRVRRSTLSRTF